MSRRLEPAPRCCRAPSERVPTGCSYTLALALCGPGGRRRVREGCGFDGRAPGRAGSACCSSSSADRSSRPMSEAAPQWLSSSVWWLSLWSAAVAAAGSVSSNLRHPLRPCRADSRDGYVRRKTSCLSRLWTSPPSGPRCGAGYRKRSSARRMASTHAGWKRPCCGASSGWSSTLPARRPSAPEAGWNGSPGRRRAGDAPSRS